ncbi:MAG: phage tail tape measure protein [Acidobacteriota bacterium]
MRRSLQRLKRIIATLGLGILIKQMVFFSNEFERSLTKINTLVGVSQQQVAAWKGDLLSLAVDAGRGPNELARALFVVTSAGERGASALDVVAEAGKASAVGLGETATIARAVTAAIQAYSKQGLEASQATSILVATVREGNLEASELAGSLGRILGIAAEAGVTFGDVGGFIATFTRLGVDANEAVTALRGTLNLLFKSGSEGRRALASVGLSLDDIRRSVREKGLAQTLVDLLDAFDGNQEALARFIPNVRALAGVLGTAGAQSEQFLAISQSVSSAMNDNQVAFEGTAQSGAHSMDRLRAAIEVVAVTLGEGFTRALSGGAGDLSDWVKENRDLFREWGRVAGEATALAASGLKLLLDYFELLKIAVATLITMKLAAWLITVAGASKIASIATLDLSTALWAVTSGYTRLVAMDMVTNLKAIAISTTALGAAGVALAFGLNEIVSAWSRALDKEREAIIESSRLAEVWGQVHRAIRKGVVSQDLFDKLTAGAEQAREELAELEAQLKKAQENSNKGGILGNVLEVQKLEEQIEAKQEDIRVTEVWIERARDMVTVIDEVTDGGGGGGGLSKLREAWINNRLAIIDHTIEVLKDIEALKALEAAAQKGQRELRLVAAALERGISPAQLLDERLRALLTTLLNLEELQGAIEASIEESLQAASDRIPKMEVDLELDVILSEAGQEVLEHTEKSLEKINEQLDQHLREKRLKAIQETYDRFLDGLQSEFANTFEAIFTNGIDSFGDLWEGVKKLAIRTLSEVAAAWAAQQFAVNIATSTGGGGGSFGGLLGSLGKLFGGGGGGGAAGAGAAGGGGAGGVTAGAWAGLGAAIAFAAIVALDSASQRHKFGAETTFGVSGGERSRSAFGQRHAIVDAWEETLDAIEDLTGGIVQDLPEIAIKIRNDGETVRVYLRGQYIGWFKTVEEAMQFALQEGLREATLSGVSEEIQQVFQAPFRSLEELMENLSFVQGLLDDGLSPMQQTARDLARDLQATNQRLEELGLSTRLGVDKSIRAWNDLRDQVAGIDLSPVEQQLRDIEGFNTELQQYINVRQQERDVVLQQVQEAERAAAILALRGDEAAAAVRELAERLPLLRDRLAQIDRELASLPDPIAPGEARRRGGGGSNRRQQRESLEDELRSIVRSGLPEFQRSIDETMSRISDLRERVQKLGANGELASEAIGVLTEQLRDQFSAALAENLRSVTGFPERLQAITDRYSDLRTANEAWLAQTGELIEARWKINEAERRALEELGQEVLASLGVPSVQTRRQMAAVAESIQFLRNNFEALGLTAGQVGEAVAATGAQLFGNLVDGLLRWTENEEARAQLEDLRFRMEIANYELQFKLLQEMGILTKEQIVLVEGLLGDIQGAYEAGEIVLPSVGNVVPITSSPRFSPVDFDPRNERLENALRLLESYESEGGSDSNLERLAQIRSDFEEIFEVLGRGARELEAYEGAIQRFWDSLIDPLRQLRSELTGPGGGSGVTSRQELDQLYGQAQQLLRAASSTDDATRIAALEQLPDVLRNLLQAGQDVLGSGSQFLSLRQFVLAAIDQLAGLEEGGASGLDGLPGSGPTTTDGIPGSAGVILAGDAFVPPVSESSDLVREVQGLRAEVRELVALTGAGNQQRGEGLGIAQVQADETASLRRTAEYSASEPVPHPWHGGTR